jgi:hypothetical protein
MERCIEDLLGKEKGLRFREGKSSRKQGRDDALKFALE